MYSSDDDDDCALVLFCFVFPVCSFAGMLVFDSHVQLAFICWPFRFTHFSDVFLFGV